MYQLGHDPDALHSEMMETMDADESGEVGFEEYFNWYIGQFV